jgi:hypothetical protein
MRNMLPTSRMVAVCLLIFLSTPLVVDSTPMILAAPNSAPQVTIQLGPLQVMRGPDTVTDNPFNTLAGDSSLIAYVANSTTIGYIGGSPETLRQTTSPVLSPGTSFDQCGAWLNSAWQDGNVVRGWYHAESQCPYPITHKSVAYAESYDNGATFIKPNYPNNQVITTPSQYANPDQDDEGDHRVIRVGDYLYMYFIPSRDWQVRVARSLVSDGGKPGTWWKYYNGNFSQPGLGGDSSPIDPTGALSRSWISFSSYLNSYMGYSYNVRQYSVRADKFAGLGFTVSSNGLNGWTAFPYLVLSSEGEYWSRNANSRELVEYPSMVSTYGNDNSVGDMFWLYYMYLNPGEDFDKRYLVRRQVRLAYTTSSAPTDLVPRIALSKYQKGKDTWFTTTTTDLSYSFASTMGYLFTDQIPNSISVYDCYIAGSADHMIDVNATCDGATNLRRMGWISTVPFANSVAVYRCYDAGASNHFISTDSTCEGKTSEWLIGYFATMPVFPDPPFVALSGYYSSAQQDHWETSTTPPSAYAFQSRLGYLLTSSAPNTIAVYDCYIADWQDHMIDINANCGNPVVQNWGRLGWISTQPFAGSVAIYRCYDATKTDHFVSLDANCNGKTAEWRIGYLADTPTVLVLWDKPLFLPIILRSW